MKSELLYELEKEDSVSSLQDNKLYRFNIESEGFADFLVFRKLEDKVICCNANYHKDGELKILTMPESKTIQYTIIDFDTVQFKTIQELYETLLKKYEIFMELYQVSETENDFFVYETSLTPELISMVDLEDELDKKYFPVEIKETLSKVVYVREKTIDDAIDRVDTLRDKEHIVLTFDNFVDYEIEEYKNKMYSFNIEDKLYDYKNNKFKKEDFEYYLAFESIYKTNQNATDEEVITITNSCYDAYLDDESGYKLTKFTDFISEHYFNEELTLEEIKNANPRDIITDSVDDILYDLKKENKEMER